MFASWSKMLERIRKRVPHRRCGYTETPFAQFCSCSRDHKIATRRWTQVGLSRGCSRRNRPDRCREYSPDRQYGDFVADSVLFKEPVEDITEDRGDVAELPRTAKYSNVSINPISLILRKFRKHTDSYSDKRNESIIIIPYEAGYISSSKYNYDLLKL